MSQIFSINKSGLDIFPGGTVLSYIGDLILDFCSDIARLEKIDNLIQDLEIFRQGGWQEYLSLAGLQSEDYMFIHNILNKAYLELLSMDFDSRNAWIKKHTIYSHLDDLWSQKNIWPQYKNVKGEMRDNNMKNVLEDILHMMKLDPRFNEDLLVDNKNFLEDELTEKSVEKKKKNIFQRLLGR